MLEQKIVEHCAPTLAGLKTANLFSYCITDKTAFWAEFSEERAKLAAKGVSIEVLRMDEKKALIYVYRAIRLAGDLADGLAARLLSEAGYADCGVQSCMERLKERLSAGERFPHEIGLFLSYPPEDVREFILQCGKNCKYCGIWKVYCNEEEAMRLFERFRKCTAVYTRLFSCGRSLQQLTVAA